MTGYLPWITLNKILHIIKAGIIVTVNAKIGQRKYKNKPPSEAKSISRKVAVVEKVLLKFSCPLLLIEKKKKNALIKLMMVQHQAAMFMTIVVI